MGPDPRHRPRRARAAAASLLVLAALATACTDGVDGTDGATPGAPWTTVTAPDAVHAVAFRTVDGVERPPRNVPFALEVEVRRGGAPAAVDALTVSGWMPGHNHGLVATPAVVGRGPGRYRVDGLLLHMRGAWQLRFSVSADGGVETLVHELLLDTRTALSTDQIERAREFSPLPPPPADPTNAVADDPAAALLGQALFFDPRLSADGSVSCATCHDPARGFADGRRMARGLAHGPRHTMTLWNAAHQRWFFWDGRKDSLWSQALSPLEDPREHGSSRLEVLHAIAADAELRAAYEEVFGDLPDLSDARRFPPAGRPVPDQPLHHHQQAWDRVSEADRRAVDRAFSNVGKALAAYERRLVAGRSPFDRFVRGLESGDPDELAALSPAAQRGFGLFVGEAACHRCHDGPAFSDLEFHTNRVPSAEGVDPGRSLGVLRLLADPFNGASEFADDGGARAARKLAVEPRGWHLPGEFRTPSLRNVAVTAPYMHEGQLATLEEVVAFYSTLEGAAPLDPDGERLVQPLGLDADQQADLVAFLRSLTDVGVPAELLRAPSSPRRSPAGR